MMKKIILIGIFIVAIAYIVAPSFAVDVADVGYSAIVLSGQSTSVTSSSSNFGMIVVSLDKTLYKSVNLTNTGDLAATVDAKFSTHNASSSDYGLVSASDKVITANNFDLRKNDTVPGSWIPLINGNTNVPITTVPAGGSVALDAILTVPVGTAAGSYSGTVVLTFGNV